MTLVDKVQIKNSFLKHFFAKGFQKTEKIFLVKLPKKNELF